MIYLENDRQAVVVVLMHDGVPKMTLKKVNNVSEKCFPLIQFFLFLPRPDLDYIPSKQSLPFLPKSPKCLKPGHLAKVITKNGRVAVGRVRYIGPLAFNDDNETFVGLQLPNKIGDCDGSIDGRKFFDWFV